MITREDFDRWRDDAVTRWVFKAIEISVQEQKAMWDETSWGLGMPKPELLRELRTRADAYRSLIDTTYEGWAETNQQEPICD